MCTRAQSNILFVAGGTGGHIFPALSVYNLFENVSSNLLWIDQIADQSANDVTKHVIFGSLSQGNKVNYPNLLNLNS